MVIVESVSKFLAKSADWAICTHLEKEKQIYD